MSKDICFISDVHLALEKTAITRRFITFLNTKAIYTKAIYILGDLFDVWVGDDDFSPPNKLIRKTFKKLTDSGVAIYLQKGNRDFLIGERFCRETGVQLLDDYAVINLYGTSTLLMHGDLLCSDDIAYQTFRLKSHTSEWQNKVLSKPLFLRLLVARWYRLRSYFHKREKSQAIMDVNQTTVINTLRHYQCYQLIHGHTHRRAFHTFELDGHTAQRIVLSEWSNEFAEVLCWNECGYRIESI